MNRYLVVDVSNLAYRALHTVGNLVHPDNPEQHTGVLYQLRSTCMQLERLYDTWKIAFAFDSRKSIRQDVYPPYKAKRKSEREAKEAIDPEAKKRRQGMHEQIDYLPSLLHRMGATNILGQTGYEADDQIASVVVNNPDTEIVIIGSDADLWQLLRPGVVMYSPVHRGEMTDVSFQADWGILPSQWASVKAWTGCDSDNIEGIRGVGEKTAIKWLKGQLKPENQKYASFADNLEIYTRNKPLVTLPYPGTQINKLADQPARLDWNLLADQIGSTNYVPEGIIDG